MMGFFYKIPAFVVIFAPLLAYTYAFKMFDIFPWEPDTTNEYRPCGCGGDRCEKMGNCKTKGFNPICCANICRCMDSSVADFTDDKARQCEICEQTQDWKILKIGKLCRNATRNEFNCWKKHQMPAPVIVKPDLGVLIEYTYT